MRRVAACGAMGALGLLSWAAVSACAGIVDLTAVPIPVEGGADGGPSKDVATDQGCVPGASCTLKSAEVCKKGVVECQGGSPICSPANEPPGTPCGAGNYCNDGECAPCTSGAFCTPSPCHTGTVSCTGGFACKGDTQADDGTACGTSGQICCGGTCASCDTPTMATATCRGTTCKSACNDGLSLCVDKGTSSCLDLSTDPDNCGACGHSCGSGGTCTGGFCDPVTVYAGPANGNTQDVVALAADSGHVVWVNSVPSGMEQDLYQTALPTGGTPIELYAGQYSTAVGVGLSGATVGFAINVGEEDPTLGTATEGKASSGAVLYTINYTGTPVALTNFGSTFYVTVSGYDGAAYGILEAPLDAKEDGGVAGTPLATITNGMPGNTMAATSKAVFWTDVKEGTVTYYNPSSMDQHQGTMAAGQAGAQNLTTDGTNLYWATGSNIIEVFASPAPGQPLTTVASSVSAATLSNLQTIAADGTNVYWADTVAGKTGIYMTPVTGGKPVLRAATAGGFPSCLAVGGNYLVWWEPNASGKTGTIRAILRP